MSEESIGAAIARLRGVRLNGQLTRDEQEQIDAVIMELEQLQKETQVQRRTRTKEAAAATFKTVSRIALALLLKDLPSSCDSE